MVQPGARAFLGSGALLESIRRHHRASHVIPLGQGLSLLPLIKELEEAIPPAAELPNEEHEDLIFLNPKIMELLFTYSEQGMLAYFETNSQGSGDQGAVLARDGKIVCGPNQGSDSINRVLRLMKVERGNAPDEFTAMGLEGFRRSEGRFKPRRNLFQRLRRFFRG